MNIYFSIYIYKYTCHGGDHSKKRNFDTTPLGFNHMPLWIQECLNMKKLAFKHITDARLASLRDLALRFSQSGLEALAVDEQKEMVGAWVLGKLDQDLQKRTGVKQMPAYVKLTFRKGAMQQQQELGCLTYITSLSSKHHGHIGLTMCARDCMCA